MLRRKAAFIAPAAGLLFLLRPGQQPPAGPVPPAGQRPPAAQAPPAPPLQPQQGGGGASPPAAGAAPLGPTLSASGGESRPTPEPSRPGPPPQPAPQGAGRHRGGPRRSGGGHGHGKSGECGNLHRLHGRPMLRWCLLKILHAEHPEATAADADRGRAAVAEARRKPVLWAAQAGAVAAVVRRRTAQQGLMGLCAVRLRWVPGHGGRDRLQLSRPANDSACGILFRFDAPRADKVARAPRPLCLLRVAGGSWTRLQFYAYGLASSLVAAAVGAITPLVARCAEELTEWPRHPTFCKLLAVHAALAGSAAFQRVLQVDLDAWFTDTAIAALRADQSMQQWLPAGGGWALAMQDDHPLRRDCREHVRAPRRQSGWTNPAPAASRCSAPPGQTASSATSGTRPPRWAATAAAGQAAPGSSCAGCTSCTGAPTAPTAPGTLAPAGPRCRGRPRRGGGCGTRRGSHAGIWRRTSCSTSRRHLRSPRTV
eukprot:TRINITY_DN13665_c0_g1_i2.p1 TRINITY_DN13665_c0_g1~~TRINITY_DN13665_c0_g1_i2.p1  ORF type:complete len:520 (+),score=54.11 TRINITY_DN13665_c0_g1_i2:112-1560(+)